MKSYSDLLIEIELIKEQIDLTEKELKYWYGIDKDGKGIPLGGKGSYKYGANTSVVQAEKKLKSLKHLNKRLKELEYAKVRQNIFLEKLEGLEYRIAYHRIVNNMTHKEIAKELGYSHDYIREVWRKVKTHKHPTDSIESG